MDATLDPALMQDLPARHAPTMGVLAKVRYEHRDMIDFIIANPQCSQGDLAARYGYSQGWISNVMASDAWQSAMAARREEVVDPVLRMSIEERMKGLVSRSLTVLMEKLDKPVVSDTVALKALELGAKSLGLGTEKAPQFAPGVDRLAALAERLIDLNPNFRKGVTYEGSVQPEASSSPRDAEG